MQFVPLNYTVVTHYKSCNYFLQENAIYCLSLNTVSYLLINYIHTCSPHFTEFNVNDVKSHNKFAKKIKLCVDVITLSSSSSDSAITTITLAGISPSPETEVNLKVV